MLRGRASFFKRRMGLTFDFRRRDRRLRTRPIPYARSELVYICVSERNVWFEKLSWAHVSCPQATLTTPSVQTGANRGPDPFAHAFLQPHTFKFPHVEARHELRYLHLASVGWRQGERPAPIVLCRRGGGARGLMMAALPKHATPRPDSYETPFGLPSDSYRTPIRHLSDTYQTPIRHLFFAIKIRPPSREDYVNYLFVSRASENLVKNRCLIGV